MANIPSILSESARRWLGSVEGVAPQMLPSRAEMAAKTGLMSFQDALMIKKLADQISGSNKDGDIPQSNVMQDKIAQISGRAPMQAPPPQMPQPQVPMPEDPRMQGGLGTLPAPNMDNAQFAGGGIIAFAEGGSSEFEARQAYERERRRLLLEQEARRERERIARARGEDINSPANMSPAAIELKRKHDENVARERALLLKSRTSEEPEQDVFSSGVGVAAPVAPRVGLGAINIDEELAKDDYSEYDRIMAQLQGDKEERQKQSEYDRRMALAAAGFRMAQAASQPGATFMGALSEGGAEGIRGLTEARRRVQDADAKTREMMMNLEMSKGADKRAARRSLFKAYSERQEALADLGLKQEQLSLQRIQVSAQMAAARAKAAASRQGASPQVAKAVSQLTKDRYEIREKLRLSPEYMELEERYKDDPNSREGKEARQKMDLLLQQATADIDRQLLNLSSGLSIVGVADDEEE